MIPTRNFDLLERYVNVFPGHNAFAEKIAGKWKYHTAEQYNEIAHHFALGLLELGFKKGDKIASITNNRPEWNFIDMGMAMIGVVHVPLYTSLSCLEYENILRHSDARFVFISDQKY